MDETLVIQQAKHSQQLLQHINSQDLQIQLTIEEPNQKGALPFLNALVSPGPNYTLVTTVYRNPMHIIQTALLPPPIWATPSILYYTVQLGTHTTSVGEYNPIQGCFPLPLTLTTLLLAPKTPNTPHTPHISQTTYTPHLSGAIFGKYTPSFM